MTEGLLTPLIHILPSAWFSTIIHNKNCISQGAGGNGNRLREEQEKRELVEHWFEQDSYINASWIKRVWMRIQFIFLDIKGEKHMPEIPAHLRMEMARCLLPDIIVFCESDKGKAEIVQRKAEQAAKKEQSKAS